ncbi:endonuclease/exonuclease/phosphatase family protein [Thiotrichales bacterium 19S3-7]|nr:endonuclease/exonuclease/phosphatase family protein [Thiotrichales bacterium 19S3-7]MCF6801196.1 endonuclease/exonuclease/phosphatase family protein [Thiotrichales bacterium 19S3-11]
MIKPAVDLKRYTPITIKSTLDGPFTLICWNVYKKLHKPKQIRYLVSLLSQYDPDLFAFQESPSINRIMKSTSILAAYEKYYFSNLEFKNRSFGLLTASSVESRHSNYVISKHKEFIFRTHKAFLVSVYPLASGEQLMLINVHAINFRSVQVYQKELQQLYEFASLHQGPLIIAGDFNSWGIGRLLLLDHLIGQLALTPVAFENANLIKSFISAPLDHILYRGLTLEKSTVLDCAKLSDHNPLVVTFSHPIG